MSAGQGEALCRRCGTPETAHPVDDYGRKIPCFREPATTGAIPKRTRPGKGRPPGRGGDGLKRGGR